MWKFSTKPKILFFADSPTTENIAKQYQKYLSEYQIDIATDDWYDLLLKDNYDILYHTNLELLMWKIPNIEDFVKEQHQNGSKVVIYDDSQILTSPGFYKPFDNIFVGNVTVFETLKKTGLNVAFIPEGLDLTNLGPDIPFQKRSFKIASRKSDFLWQKMRQKWPQFEFVEIFDKHVSTEILHQIYNECQVFYGPIGFMEAAACGVIPVMRNRAGLENYKNIFVADSDESVLEIISSLKENPEATLFSQRVSKEMLTWDYRLLSSHWGKNIEDILLKKKAVNFT